MYDTALIGGEVYAGGGLFKSNVFIKDGVIRLISLEEHPSKDVVDCSGLFILPGIIDPHVHMELNLGHVTSCDDFYQGSVAAAFGGVTTILDFLDPIESESEYADALKSRMEKAKASIIDYGFHATLGNFSGDVKELVRQVKRSGLSSIKVFTTYSESDRKVPKEVLKVLLGEEIVTMVHAEDDELVDARYKEISTFENSRPLTSELSALKDLLALKIRGVLYVVHVSSGSGVELLSNMKHVVIESCPHYFYLSKESFKEEQGALYLLAPPLRSREERDKLNKRISLLTTIGTDHCPFKKEEKLKSEDAAQVPKGIGSISYSFLLMYNKFGIGIIDKMSKNVAAVFGLKDKGEIIEGHRADLFLFDPLKHTVVSAQMGASDYSVYQDMVLKGAVIRTMVGGKVVMDDGRVFENKGQFVRSDFNDRTDEY